MKKSKKGKRISKKGRRISKKRRTPSSPRSRWKSTKHRKKKLAAALTAVAALTLLGFITVKNDKIKQEPLAPLQPPPQPSPGQFTWMKNPILEETKRKRQRAVRKNKPLPLSDESIMEMYRKSKNFDERKMGLLKISMNKYK